MIFTCPMKVGNDVVLYTNIIDDSVNEENHASYDYRRIIVPTYCTPLKEVGE